MSSDKICWFHKGSWWEQRQSCRICLYSFDTWESFIQFYHPGSTRDVGTVGNQTVCTKGAHCWLLYTHIYTSTYNLLIIYAGLCVRRDDAMSVAWIRRLVFIHGDVDFWKHLIERIKRAKVAECVQLVDLIRFRMKKYILSWLHNHPMFNIKGRKLLIQS